MNSGGSPSGDKRAADIADQKNEKHHDVDIVPPRGVGADQRPDQDHGRARGADDAGDQRAEGEHRRIDQRRAAHRAGDENAAGNHIEREQDGDEAEIVAEQRMHQGRERGVDAAQAANGASVTAAQTKASLP